MATILVEILGNAKQFKSELDGAVASTEKANTGFGKMHKAAGAAGLALAGGLAFGLVKSVEAADAMQQSTARMNAAFAASHVPVKAFSGAIDNAEASARKLGFGNEQVRGSLGSLVIATHDGHKAIKDLGVAEDIARFKHVSLEAATKMLTMAMAGSQRAVKQLGIDVPKVTTAQDALKASGNTLKQDIITQTEVVKKLTLAHDTSAAGVKKLKDAQMTLSVEQTHAKEVMLSHTSEVYKNEVAHAKLVDRMSTANAVIATVTEKLHGQAAAYAGTAAGGMAQFHAQLSNLAEKLGAALLPALTTVATELAKVSGFFSANMGATHALVIGLGALAAVLLTVSAVTKVVAAGQAIVTAATYAWSAAMAVVRGATYAWAAAQYVLDAALAANPIGVVIIAVAALAAGIVLAYQHSATFRRIVSEAFNAVEGAARSVLGFFRSNWPIIATLISGPFAPLVALATNAFGIRSALTGAFASILGAVGSAVGGIVHFFTALPGRIVGALGNLGSLLVNAGEQLMQGLLSGIQSGLGKVKDFVTGIGSKLVSWKGPPAADAVLLVDNGTKIMQGLHDGLKAGLGQIETWLTTQTALPNAMKQGLQNAINAGRTVIQAGITQFQGMFSQLTSYADKAFAGTVGAVQTPAEKRLAEMQDQKAADDRQQALNAANAQLTAAQAGGDPAVIAQAQQAVYDAQYQIQLASLQKQAAEERIQLDARNALQQQKFDEALAHLEAHLAKGHTSYKKAHEEIIALFKKFGVKYNDAGRELGIAFITGLKEAITEAAKGSGALKGKLEGVASGIHVPHAQSGGYVSQTGLAVIHAGETVVPAGGGGAVHVTVNGWVGNDQDIAEKIRNVLIRTGRNTTGGALGGFA